MKLNHFFFSLLLPLSFITACDKQDTMVDCCSLNNDVFMTRSNCSEDNNIVYQKSTNTWLVKQDDPYCLDYQKRVIEKNDKLKRLFASSKSLELLPTHLAIRLYPKNEEEYEAIVNMKDVDVAYSPFDHVPVKVGATTAKEDVLYLEDRPKYTIKRNIYDIDGNLERIDTEEMPVLYAVWPIDKPLPNGVDYEIDYEVLIPKKSKHYLGNEAVLNSLERESVFQATGIEITKTASRGIYHITDYDNQLGTSVPLPHLKVRFQIGSSINDRITDNNGAFTYNYVSGTTVQAILQSDKWIITNSSSTNPLMIDLTSQFASGASNIEVDNSLCPVFRALEYYYYGNHGVILTNNSSLIRVKIITNYSGHSGEFHPGLLGPSAIDIYTGIYEDMELFEKVCHEMGHFNHYLRRGNFFKYTSVHRLFKESYASYSGWHVGTQYFLTYNPTASESVINRYIGDRWQNWKSTDTGDGSHYSPLFVDLIDDFNQSVNNASLNNDTISGSNHQIIFAMIAPKNWQDIKSKLSEYIGSSFTQNEFNSFIAPYDYYFTHD